MALHKCIRIHQYLDDWLVSARSHQTCLQHTNLSGSVSGIRFDGEYENAELDHKQVFDLQALHSETLETAFQTDLPGQTSVVSDRVINGHREAGPPRSAPYETDTVALERRLEVPTITRKGDPYTQVTSPLLKMVASGRKSSSRPAITNTSTEGWGAHLREYTAISTWSLPESKLHINYNIITILYGTKGGLSGPKRVPRPLLKQGSTYSNSQNHSGCLYKQGRRHEVGSSVYPSVENPDLVLQETGNSQGQTHSRPAECSSRQAIQARPRPPRQWSLLPEVFYLKCTRWHQPQIDMFAKLLQGSITNCLFSRCTQPVLGGFTPLFFPSSSHFGQSGGEIAGLPLQENCSVCSVGGQHALVLGSSGYVKPNPSVLAHPA